MPTIIMQNKANCKTTQISASLFEEKNYRKISSRGFYKNKPKQSQFLDGRSQRELRDDDRQEMMKDGGHFWLIIDNWLVIQ